MGEPAVTLSRAQAQPLFGRLKGCRQCWCRSPRRSRRRAAAACSGTRPAGACRRCRYRAARAREGVSHPPYLSPTQSSSAWRGATRKRRRRRYRRPLRLSRLSRTRCSARATPSRRQCTLRRSRRPSPRLGSHSTTPPPAASTPSSRRTARGSPLRTATSQRARTAASRTPSPAAPLACAGARVGERSSARRSDRATLRSWPPFCPAFCAALRCAAPMTSARPSLL
mmetsp:Transcript_26950/g.88704  ORF Transcript_26950/g.88704 Transcript_26950/m.88704 type:complete len:226 (-) Transcript_26950:1271-1948(-)